MLSPLVTGIISLSYEIISLSYEIISLSYENISEGYENISEGYENLKSASNLNGNLNGSKELEHYAS